jgi:hypothetical protein
MPSPTGKYQKGDVRQVAVDAASTANVDLSAAVSVVFDGITLVEGDLVLLKDQTSTEENGVYKVGAVSSATALLTRHAVMDESFETFGGLRVYVDEGTLAGGECYVLTTAGAITVGTTSLTFTKQPTYSELTSLETRLSSDESTGALSAASEYTSLTTRVSNVESTETATTTSLTTRVSTEEAARASADTSLETVDSENLSTEVSDVASIDAAISTELSTRASADTSLTTLASVNASTAASAAVSLTTVASANLSTEVADVASIDAAISSLIASIDA